jgi:hypothetical protein
MRYVPEILATSELGIPLMDYDIQFSGVLTDFLRCII